MNAALHSETEEWHRRRLGFIGGSDVHHVFSEPPYGCQLRLWFEKRGVEPDYKREQTLLMERGKALEGVAADLYAERTGRILTRRPTIQSERWPWIGVNLDREIAPVPEHDGPGALEVKTAGAWEFRRVQQEGLRPAYLLQLQHALVATELKWGAFQVLHPDTWRSIAFDVEADVELQERIVDGNERFWRRVEHGPKPDPLPEIDGRCKTCPWRKTCRGDALIAAAIEPIERSEILDEDEQFAELLTDYAEAHRIAEDANATLDAIKDEIRRRMGDRVAVGCHGARIYYRPQISNRWDTKALGSDHPELAGKYKRPSASRPLRIYPA